MFGCCKTFSGKYIFSRNANFQKRKIFLCVWLHFKKFSGKYFLVFRKEEGKHKSENTKQKPQPEKKIINDHITRSRSRRDLDRDRRRNPRSRWRQIAIAISPSIAPSDWSWSSRSRTGSSPLARAHALSLSLSFRKWIEVKMRGEIHFRVKGEICSQPEIIFRKIMFSVAAKRMDFPEIDFWNWFSPDSNAA